MMHENEKKEQFKSYVSFYKSIIDQDRCAVVICNLKHEIIYMNPAAVLNYEKWGEMCIRDRYIRIVRWRLPCIRPLLENCLR